MVRIMFMIKPTFPTLGPSRTCSLHIKTVMKRVDKQWLMTNSQCFPPKALWMLTWASALETAAWTKVKKLSYESHYVKMLHMVFGWIIFVFKDNNDIHMRLLFYGLPYCCDICAPLPPGDLTYTFYSCLFIPVKLSWHNEIPMRLFMGFYTVVVARLNMFFVQICA